MKKLLLILLCLPIIGCVSPPPNKSEASYNDEILINEEPKEEINKIQQLLPFNYAINGQRPRYEPFLYGAEGWIYPRSSIITDECGDTSSSKKIRIVSQSLRHTSYGNYKGTLFVEYIDDTTYITQINYKCFTPDYDIGEWRSKDRYMFNLHKQKLRLKRKEKNIQSLN